MTQGIAVSPELATDEIELARIVCDKLAKRLQGTLSVGVPSFVTGVPKFASFLDDQFEVMKALAIVLHTLSGRPSVTALILQSRKISADLRTELDNLREDIIAAKQALSDQKPDPFSRAKKSTANIGDLIHSFMNLLGMKSSLGCEVKLLAERMFDPVTELFAAQSVQPCTR